MIRFAVRIAVVLVANAAGLIVAALVLGRMDIDLTSFISALIIFTVMLALLTPFITGELRKRDHTALLGGAALVATLVSLIATDLLSNGLSIHGITTWIWATLIVWGASLIAAAILPRTGLRRYLDEGEGPAGS